MKRREGVPDKECGKVGEAQCRLGELEAGKEGAGHVPVCKCREAKGRKVLGGHMSMCEPMEAGKEATGGWMPMREHRETRGGGHWRVQVDAEGRRVQCVYVKGWWEGLPE